MQNPYADIADADNPALAAGVLVAALAATTVALKSLAPKNPNPQTFKQRWASFKKEHIEVTNKN